MANNRKSSANVGVDNLVDNAFVSDMNSRNDREKLGYDQAPQKKWETKPIISYVPMHDQSDDLLASIDVEVSASNAKVANGENKVVLLGCEQVKNLETGKVRLHMTLQVQRTKAIVEVNLFPGESFTDYQGKVVPAGHNWKALAEEVKRQRNAAHKGLKDGLGFVDLLKTECTKGFVTWLLYDGKYMNMYTTERKYQAALDRLAKGQKQGK